MERGQFMGVESILVFLIIGAVAGWLAGEPTHGSLWKAGLPKHFKTAVA